MRQYPLRLLKDKGNNEVEQGTANDACRYSYKKQPVKELITVFFFRAGTKNQGSARGEGTNGTGLCTEYRAGEKNRCGNSRRAGKTRNEREECWRYNTCGRAEEAHDGPDDGKGDWNQGLWHVASDSVAQHGDGSCFDGNGNQHAGACNHDNSVPRYFGNGLFLWGQIKKQGNDSKDDGN